MVGTPLRGFPWPPASGAACLREAASAKAGAPAIRGHTLSCKGARLSRSLDAREASPLRNATTVVCRFAAIKKAREPFWLSHVRPERRPCWSAVLPGPAFCRDAAALRLYKRNRAVAARGRQAETGARADPSLRFTEGEGNAQLFYFYPAAFFKSPVISTLLAAFSSFCN